MDYDEFLEKEDQIQEAFEKAIHKALQEVECEIYELDWFSSWAKKNVPPADPVLDPRITE